MEISGCQRPEGFLEKWEMTANGYGVSLCGDENVLELIVLTVAQLCEYTKKTLNHKWMNCLVCKLYLNKAVVCIF